MTLKLNYQMKHAVNLFGGNIIHLKISGQNMKECILMYLDLRLPLQEFARTAIIEAISISELCQTALQQLLVLIIKVVLRSRNAMKSQKKYGCSVLKIILSSLWHECQENIILKQTSFLENLTIIQNDNLILRYFFEITNKFPYPEIDPFATRTNTQLQNYVSWSCELQAKVEDAFLTHWGINLVKFFLHLVYWGK